MKQRILESIIIISLLLAVIGVGYWLFRDYPEVQELWKLVLVELELATPESERAVLSASGFIEVRQTTIAPEVSGRVVRLLVGEGDQVQEGQALAELDADLLDARILEAQAALAIAQAQLARIEAGVRAEDIALAEAALNMAEAGRDAAYQAWQDAILLRDNPQELDLQIATARSEITVLEHRIQQMAALKDAAVLIDDLRRRQVSIAEEGIDWSVKLPNGRKISGHAELPEGAKRQAWAGWNLASTDLWSAWANLNQVSAALDAAQQNLIDLRALRANPQQVTIQVTQAEGAYQEALAAVGVAQADLDLARAGASQEQIEVARTGVEQAQAALKALEVERRKYTLGAPVAGVVLERIIHEGEIALPGTILFTLGSLDKVDLTIYIPEPDMGRVFISQPVAVSVDSFPAQVFTGQVIWISDEAEFTPKNIQTKEERVNTVFAVKVGIPNPDHKLKPGMPADARIMAQ